MRRDSDAGSGSIGKNSTVGGERDTRRRKHLKWVRANRANMVFGSNVEIKVTLQFLLALLGNHQEQVVNGLCCCDKCRAVRTVREFEHAAKTTEEFLRSTSKSEKA